MNSLNKEQGTDVKKTRTRKMNLKEATAHKLGKSKGMGGKGSFIEKLEAHKREAASFDNGTWKPKKKGESFIDALERHKANREFY